MKDALRKIILAQIASDGGKEITELLDIIPENLMPSAQKAWDSGYAVKDKLLLQACQIVARHKYSDLHFFVTEDLQNIAKYIVYFDVYIDGHKWQVSFHSFGNEWGKWKKSSMLSRGHWDHKSSRKSCEVFLNYLQFLSGR